jgi:hypothetical protein
MFIKKKSEDEWGNLPAKVEKWFEDALRNDEKRPSLAEYYELGREFQIIFNRHDNSEHERKSGSVPPLELKDVCPKEYEAKKLNEFYHRVKQVLIEADKLEEYFGNYTWEDSHGAISLAEIAGTLQRVNYVTPSSLPQKTWEETGRKIAKTIQIAMRKAGETKRLSAIKSENITAIVGARAITWAFEKVTPEQFAEKMRNRRRRAKGEIPATFEARFPLELKRFAMRPPQ